MKKTKFNAQAVLIIMIIMMFGLAGCSSSSSSAIETWGLDAETTIYGEDMYLIGDDMPAGEYRIFSYEPEKWEFENDTFKMVDYSIAYMELSKDSSGSIDSIITNENLATFMYLTVKKGQYLSLKDAFAIPVSEFKPKDWRESGIFPGMYKVGFDIPAGKYKLKNLSSDTDAYVAVLRDSKGTINSIVTNDIFSNKKYVTVKKGQYLHIMNCYAVEYSPS